MARTPDQQADFVRDHPDALAPENGAWGRAGCTVVRLAVVDEETLGEAMTLAWRNAATKPFTAFSQSFPPFASRN